MQQHIYNKLNERDVLIDTKSVVIFLN